MFGFAGEYFGNFMSYYTKGGFTDATTGERHHGFNYTIPWFEFGNEMEYASFVTHATYGLLSLS